MTHGRPEQRLLEQPEDAGDPLVRAMRAALSEDPAPELLARVGARVGAAITEGRSPKLDDALRGSGPGSTASWLVGAGVTALVAGLALVALHGTVQTRPRTAPARVGSGPLPPIAVPNPGPRPPVPAARAPLPSRAAAARQPREREARSPEPARAPGPEAELELLRRAQQALPRDGRAALRLTQEHQRTYAHGLLEQERELLAIEALLSLHDLEHAQTRSLAFRRTFPHSVHLRRLDRMLAQAGQDTADGNQREVDTPTP